MLTLLYAAEFYFFCCFPLIGATNGKYFFVKISGEKLAVKLRQLEQEKMQLEWQRAEEEGRRQAEETARREDEERLKAKEKQLREQEVGKTRTFFCFCRARRTALTIDQLN